MLNQNDWSYFDFQENNRKDLYFTVSDARSLKESENWSLLLARFTALTFLIRRFPCFLWMLKPLQRPLFKVKEEMFCGGGGLLQHNPERFQSLSPRPSHLLPPSSLVTVWGIQSNAWPVTCSLRNKQPAESPKTKAIRGGRLVRQPHHGTSLKASIIEKLWVVAVESD